jgi:hypothetical protein
VASLSADFAGVVGTFPAKHCCNVFCDTSDRFPVQEMTMNKALRIAVLAAVAVVAITLTAKSANASKVTTIPVITIPSTP